MTQEQDTTDRDVNFLIPETPRDLRLTHEQIVLTRATLQSLKRLSGYPEGYDQQIKGLLDQQDQFASLHQTERLLQKAQVKLTRHAFFKYSFRIACFGVLAGLGFIGANCVNQSCFTPEAQARWAEQNRLNAEANRLKAEEDKANKIEAENKQMLGLTPSAVSSTGFRIRYLAPDNNVRYEDISGKYSYITLARNTYISLHELKEEGKPGTRVFNTNIFYEPYARAQDGMMMVRMIVQVDTNILDRRILSNEGGDGVDTSVLVFEDMNSEREYIFGVTPLDNNFNNLQLQLKQRVAVNPE